MIYNTNTIYAKVWTIKPSEKYLDLQISTSEKDEDGNYKNSSWFPRVIGKAFNTLKNLKEGDRICITKSKFTNERYEDKDGNKRSYFKFLILEATIEGDAAPADEPAPKKSTSTKPVKKAEQQSEVEKGDDGDEECPW